MDQSGLDCRELVGMAIAKRAAGRNWRQIREDLLFYVQGRGLHPQIRGHEPDYQLLFPGGWIFFHRANGEYGFEGPEGVAEQPESSRPAKNGRLRAQPAKE